MLGIAFELSITYGDSFMLSANSRQYCGHSDLFSIRCLYDEIFHLCNPWSKWMAF